MTGFVSRRRAWILYRAVRATTCIVVIGLLSGPARAEKRAAPTSRPSLTDPAQGVFADDWYAVRLMGERAGHMH